MRFPAHGHFRLTVKDTILMSEVVGPFNKEAIELYYKELQLKCNNELSRVFNSHLIVIKGSGLFTWCASGALSQLLKSTCFYGSDHTAIVCENIDEKFILKDLYHPYLTNKESYIKQFHSINKALLWLNKNR